MHNVRKIADDTYWIGANDNRLERFENIHPIPEGISYNSYFIDDEKTAVLDAVDWSQGRIFFDNIKYLLKGRQLDYLVINHMEPDHAATLDEVLLRYPEISLVMTKKAADFARNFGFHIDDHEIIEVKEGDKLELGDHTLNFVLAPMVHWPEVMVSYDSKTKVLFSADAFGTFGCLNGRIFNDEVDFEGEFLDHARRYFTNIVGKYGGPTQNLLKKAGKLDLEMIAPLHGPVWRSNLDWYIDKHDKWSSYTPEEEGVLLVYGSMYGNTEEMANVLAEKIAEKGMTNIRMYDASKTHVSYLVAEAFKLSHIVVAAPTYNLNLYPPVDEFLRDLHRLNLQNRKFAVLENGSWAPTAGKKILEHIASLRKCQVINEDYFHITSSLKEDQLEDLDKLAQAIVDSF